MQYGKFETAQVFRTMAYELRILVMSSLRGNPCDGYQQLVLNPLMEHYQMNDMNPEIEEQLNKLADLCCESLDGQISIINDQSEALLKSLVMSGFVRNANASLQAEIESRVKQKCAEPSIHRGGELTAMTQKLQEKLKKISTWDSNSPSEFTPSRPANISSATDS